MLFLKKEDIIKSFSMREAIDADKKALSLYSAGKASVPLRTNIDVPKSNGQSLYMPAYVEGGEGALVSKSFPCILKTSRKTYQVYQQR